MARKGQSSRYYRTAALLGPQEQHAAFGARPRPLRLRVPWRVMIALLGIIALGLWVALGDFWYLMWEDLDVTGVTSAELQHQIKVDSDLLGWHLVHLGPEVAEEALIAKYPQFAEVTVSCIPIPTSCRVAVVERTPVLAWEDGSGVYWVDAGGVVYPAQAEGPELPVLRGPIPTEAGQYSMVEVLKGVSALAELGIPAHELQYMDDRGLIWTDPQGLRVAFGVGSEMGQRWRAYQSLAAHLAEQGIYPQTMDVRFPGGVTYSLQRSW